MAQRAVPGKAFQPRVINVTLQLIGPILSYNYMKNWEYHTWDPLYNTSFSS
jgi:hypothetical protein